MGLADGGQREEYVSHDEGRPSRHARRRGRQHRLHVVDLAVAATPLEVLYDNHQRRCHMFARAIAVEFRDRGIRCNAVCPGFIRTAHGMREVEQLTKGGVDVSEATMAVQQGRMCEPEEVARAALFLASDESSFINGTHLFVDNCFTAV